MLKCKKGELLKLEGVKVEGLRGKLSELGYSL